MTFRRYYTDSARRGSATIDRIDSDERGSYLVLDATLFHPQGGGQPADHGLIEGARVIHVSATDGEILHYVDSTEDVAVGQMVSLAIDDSRRTLHERLHTAGHLIGSLVEYLFPQAEAIAGHHWPNESRVDFQLLLDTLDVDSLTSILEPEIRRAISRGSGVYACESSPALRMVVIEGYRPIPCGGTHVRTVADIGVIVLRTVAAKRRRLRIGYDVDESD